MKSQAPFLLLPVLLATGCSDGCGKQVISRSDSPDGRHSAVLYEANCGATTDFATHVAVVDAGDEPSFDGLVFAADSNHGQAELGDWGGPKAHIAWIAPNRLQITYAAGARIFQRKERMAGVEVILRAD